MRYYSFSGYARVLVNWAGKETWKDVYIATFRFAAFTRKNAIEILREEAKARAAAVYCVPESRILRVYFEERQLNKLEPQAYIIR